ncbi:Hexuronic acid methyltransferase AglP [Candidatus Anstonella stagnisolia]|nr:Hexuronic acid methyltransferase AglP [Candidatus Anstonella stagnisolia]
MRTGEELKIILRGRDGTARELDSLEELRSMRGDIKSNLAHIVKYSIATGKFRNFYLLLRIAAKKYLLNRTYEERRELMDGCFGTVEMEFQGRHLSFAQGGLFFPLLLIEELFIHNQYDVNKGNMKGKIVVDAGANIGAFSMLCACFGAEKVYAFEPLEGTYKMLVENIRANGLEGVVVPIKKAVGDKESAAQIKYNYSGDGASSISRTEDAGKNVQQIEVVSLDNFLNGENVGFIKMDVEGYEEKALLGAKRIIKKNKPVLSLSAYHKPTDMEVLPRTIKSIRQDYSIKLIEHCEKDFYCD